MRPQIWCFDLDGTLVDTSDLNRKIYEACGVKMPTHANGLSWREWLPLYCGGNVEAASIIHDRKTFLYAQALAELNVARLALPALEIAQEIYADNPTRVRVLTAAATISARRLLNRFGLENVEYHAELSYDSRRDQLARWNDHANITYVDDNSTTIERLQTDFPRPPLLNLIHYTDQDVHALRLVMGVQRWTQ